MLRSLFFALLSASILNYAYAVRLTSSLEGNSNGGGACPAETVVFTCTAPSTVISWSIPSLELFRNIAVGNLGTGFYDDPFEFVDTEYDGENLTSLAIVNASDVSSGTRVICIDASVAGGGETDSATLDHVVLPSTPTLSLDASTIVKTDSNTWNITLKWNSPAEDFVSCYSISQSPGESWKICDTHSAVFELQLDKEYSFAIFALNCDGAQRGDTSDDFIVEVQMPASPRLTLTSLTYNGTSTGEERESLVSIRLTWNPVDGTADIAPSVDGSILGYHISGNGIAPVDVPLSSCSSGVCMYRIDISGDSTQGLYTVSLAARNAAGLGEATTTEPQSARNDFVSVEIDTSESVCGVTITCVQLSGTYSVEVDPEYTATLSCADNGDTAVATELQQSSDFTDYAYRVTGTVGSTEVLVQGTFIASCHTSSVDKVQGNSSDGERTGIIVGVSVGAVVLVTILALAAIPSTFYCYKRRRFQKKFGKQKPLSGKEIESALPTRTCATVILRGQVCKVKKLSITSTADIADVKRITDETVQKLRNVNDRRLVCIWESSASEDNSTWFLVMPLVEGESLNTLIETGNMTNRRRLYIARKVAKAIRYLHSLSRPVTHQDLKPTNIFVEMHRLSLCNWRSKVQLVEVGIADIRRIAGDVSNNTHYYRAPEVYIDWQNINNPSADIYSLGCVLIELFGGMRPSQNWPSGVTREGCSQLLNRYWSLCESCHSTDPDKRLDIQTVLDRLSVE